MKLRESTAQQSPTKEAARAKETEIHDVDSRDKESQGIDVTIIIPNWNTCELTVKCLESVYRTPGASVGQTLSFPTFEVIVIDNASSDESVSTIASSFPRARLIENEVNLGFAKACNLAMEQMNGRYALLLNSDCVLTPRAVEGLVSFMDANLDVGIAGGQLLNNDDTKQSSFDNFPSLATTLLNKSLLKRLFPKKYPSKLTDYSAPIDVESVIGACMIVRREAMKEVGLLDEDYFFFMEETDWCYRMRGSGWRVCFVPEAKIYHLQGQSAKLAPVSTRIEYCRSVYLFFKKHRGSQSYLAVRALRFIKTIINFCVTFLGLALTLFQSARLRRKSAIHAQLLLWHLKFCPKRKETLDVGA